MTKRAPPDTLELVRGDAVIGTIDVKPGETDLPWYTGKFNEAPAFESARELFEQELVLLRANTDDDDAQWDDWELVHSELHEPGLRLRSPDNAWEADEILIHIDGDVAWWRVE